MRYTTTRTTTTIGSPDGLQNENVVGMDRGTAVSAGNVVDRRLYDRGAKGWLVVLVGFLVQTLIFAVRGNLRDEWTRSGLREAEKDMWDWVRWSMFLAGEWLFLLKFRRFLFRCITVTHSFPLTGPFAAFIIRRIGTMFSMLVAAFFSVAACLIAQHAMEVASLPVVCGILLGKLPQFILLIGILPRSLTIEPFSIGMGFGIAFISCYAVLLDYFRRYLGLAAVIVTVGCGVGEVLGPYIYRGLPNYYGKSRSSSQPRTELSSLKFRKTPTTIVLFVLYLAT